MLEFYHHPLSPWSRQVHLFLEESGLPYEIKQLDLQKGQQRQAPFKQINPFGRVPAIQVDDFRLGESGAIIRYLVQKTQRFDLYPASLEERALVEQWTEFLNRHMNRYLLDLYWHRTMAKHFGMPSEQAVIDRATKNLTRDFATLEEHLQGRNYLVGATCTMADLMALPFFTVEGTGWEMENYPAISSWLKRVSERKSWKKVQ